MGGKGILHRFAVWLMGFSDVVHTGSMILNILGQGIGVAVTTGSCTLKIPQIVKCIRADSVDGLSLFSNYVELEVAGPFAGPAGCPLTICAWS